MFSKLCQLSFYKRSRRRICWSKTGFMRRGSDVLVCFLFSTLNTDPIISDRKLKQNTRDGHCNTINSHFKQCLLAMCFPPKVSLIVHLFVLVRMERNVLPQKKEAWKTLGGVHKFVHDVLWGLKWSRITSHFIIIRKQQVFKGKI